MVCSKFHALWSVVTDNVKVWILTPHIELSKNGVTLRYLAQIPYTRKFRVLQYVKFGEYHHLSSNTCALHCVIIIISSSSISIQPLG